MEKLELEKIRELLQSAINWDLTAEVVISAFNHKEQFPDVSILECLQVGLDEEDI